MVQVVLSDTTNLNSGVVYMSHVFSDTRCLVFWSFSTFGRTFQGLRVSKARRSTLKPLGRLKQNQTILPAEYCSLLRKINQITPYKNIRELLGETSGNPEQDSWCTDVKHTRPSGKTNDVKAQWRVLKWTIVIEICWQAFNVQLNTVSCSFCLLQGNNSRFPWQKVTLKW